MKPQIKPELLSWLCLVTLALIWGVNFIFIKISVEDVGPTTNVFFRLLLGSIVLSIYLRSSKSKLPLENKNLLFYLILGFLGLALPFFLISSASEPSRDFFNSAIASSIDFFSSAETLSPCSLRLFSVEKTRLSA